MKKHDGLTDYETRFAGSGGVELHFKAGYHPATIIDSIVNEYPEKIDKSKDKRHLSILRFFGGMAFYWKGEHIGNLVPVYPTEGKIELLGNIFSEYGCTCKQCKE
jgi:hypothetical protein